MPHSIAFRITTVVVVGTGLIVAAPPPEKPASDALAVRLTGGDLGDGTALIMGPSGFPIPAPQYMTAMNELYLHHLGFGGTTEPVFTPEGLYPITGTKTLMLDPSTAQGTQALEIAIQNHLADATVTNPIVVSGFSQSSMVSTQVMEQLHDGVAGVNGGAPVDPDLLHFVLVGDPYAPNGGFLSRFDVPVGGQSPTVPALGVSFDNSTPSDLYPTDIYTNEYDGFADFPRYPINLLSDINAYLGILYDHATYAVNMPGQIVNAIELPGSADLTGEGMTNYWMMPTDQLPLLAPLKLLPFVGTPLYNLLAPDMTILVNLGYGQIGGVDPTTGEITGGWDPGPADQLTTFGLLPGNSADFNWGDVLPALGKGLVQGVESAFTQLTKPENWELTPLLQNPSLEPLGDAAYMMGLTNNPHATAMEVLEGTLKNFANYPVSTSSLFDTPFSLTNLVNEFTGTLAADYSTLLPIGDTVNTLLTTVPSVLATFVAQELAGGNIIGAIGDPIAVATALVPFLAVVGAGVPVVEALGGNLVNLLNLFDLGGVVNAIGGSIDVTPPVDLLA